MAWDKRSREMGGIAGIAGGTLRLGVWSDGGLRDGVAAYGVIVAAHTGGPMWRVLMALGERLPGERLAAAASCWRVWSAFPSCPRTCSHLFPAAQGPVPTCSQLPEHLKQHVHDRDVSQWTQDVLQIFKGYI